MIPGDAGLSPRDVIAIKYRTLSQDGDASGGAERWIQAVVIECEPGTWPLVRLVDGQITEVRAFMPWRFVRRAADAARHTSAAA
jgi:hypothetical protein